MYNKKINFSFINKNGEKKTVHVFVDEETYKILPKLNEDDKIKYLTELYHDQEREKNYKRKTIPFSQYINDENGQYDPVDEHSDLFEDVSNEQLIKQIMEYLSPKDRVFIKLYFYDGLTKIEIAEKLNINRRTVYLNLKRIISDLKNKFNR